MRDFSDSSVRAEFIADCLRLYRHTLLDDVVPFWLRHGIDRVHGGIGNILDDSGKTLGTDKYLWSQGRALWTFSALYNRVKRRPEWLAVANHIFDYLRIHGRDDQGRWQFRLNEAGKVLDGPISIYADGFVLAGLTEFFKATGDPEARAMALETFQNTNSRIRTPGSYGVAPYEIPSGFKTHGVNMIFALFYFELGQALADEAIGERGAELAREILAHFYVAEKDAILEFVTLQGDYVDSSVGRACVPGHAIESLWFLITIFESLGDLERISLCCRLIRHQLELGWDERFGGLLLAIDIDGVEPPYWKNADCKPWWVAVEALVATAYAYRHCGEAWCLQWHERVRDFAFSHYPVSTGEWTPWVDRQGRRMRNAVLPVKDPFHLPRALMHLTDVLAHL